MTGLLDTRTKRRQNEYQHRSGLRSVLFTMIITITMLKLKNVSTKRFFHAHGRSVPRFERRGAEYRERNISGGQAGKVRIEDEARGEGRWWPLGKLVHCVSFAIKPALNTWRMRILRSKQTFH